MIRKMSRGVTLLAALALAAPASAATINLSVSSGGIDSQNTRTCTSSTCGTAIWTLGSGELYAATGTITLDQRAALRLATTHAIRLAVNVVDAAYNAAGVTAIYDGHVLQRSFQDVHVISQHLQARLAHYELVGQHWLGLKIDESRL